MPNLTLANREGKSNESGFSPLTGKVQYVTKLLKGNDNLVRFLNKLFARREMQSPSADEVQYLHILFDEIIETLSEPNDENADILLFKVLLRYNFNHESVRKYYISEIDHFIVAHPKKTQGFLKKVMRYCQTLDRKDLAYNKAAYSLREEIEHHIKLRIEQAEYFRPFKVLSQANVFYPFMRLLMDAGVFEEMEPSDAWKSMLHVFRDNKGHQFSSYTVKNRYNFDAGTDLGKLKDLIAKLDKTLEDYIRIRARKSG